jgi:Icc-related predicted phosphoesterase
MTIRIVAISDTHGFHRGLEIPDGDLLIHAGDLTGNGTLDELSEFNGWLASLPHCFKIVIAGNHDWCFERRSQEAVSCLTAGVYLQDQGVLLNGLTIYGSPWQPWFFNWAFNLQRGAEIRAKWDMIPTKVDVLVTHGPPLGHGDATWRGEHAGCHDLLAAVERIRPKLHIFGHIHEGAGVTESDHTTFVNASSCDAFFSPVNPPIVIDL